jgi:predicted NBD/HSP70 family sugar kinase
MTVLAQQRQDKGDEHQSHPKLVSDRAPSSEQPTGVNSVRRDGDVVLAIDIGGTKVKAAVIDASGRILRETQFGTPHGEPMASLLHILDRAAALDPGPARACGICLPALVREGRIVWSAETIPAWNGIDLRALASDRLGVPCAVDFDGYAACLGEWWAGRARGHRDAAVVVVGTGIGAGFIHDGQLYRGAASVAGAIGWLRLARAQHLGPRVEDVASGPAILAAARRLRRDLSAYEDTAAVFTAAQRGDRAAQRAVRQATMALTAAVGAIVALLAPSIVVLGGSVGARDDVVEAIRRQLPNAAPPYALAGLEVGSSSLGPAASLYGAARLALTLR